MNGKIVASPELDKAERSERIHLVRLYHIQVPVQIKG
jgi:hypothetical protein